MIWESFAKAIVYITKTVFIGLMLVSVLLLFISYTNIGGSMDILRESYYEISGHELNTKAILLDLKGKVDGTNGILKE